MHSRLIFAVKRAEESALDRQHKNWRETARAHEMEVSALRKEIARREEERETFVEEIRRLENALDSEKEQKEEALERMRTLEGERDELRATVKSQVCMCVYVCLMSRSMALGYGGAALPLFFGHATWLLAVAVEHVVEYLFGF